MKRILIWFSVFTLILSDYLGCYKDGSPRDLLQRLHHNNVTVNNCVSGCHGQEYEYAALQFSYLCFCGDHYGTFGKLPDEMCDSACRNPGDQYCGGDWRNSVYSTGYKGKKKNHHKRDQVVLFEGPKEIQTSDFVDDIHQDDVSGSQKSFINTPPRPRFDVPDSFDTPHVHINPTEYNENNTPGSPGESISAFPLATSAPPLETPSQPLEETGQNNPGTLSTTGQITPEQSTHVEPVQTSSGQMTIEQTTPEQDSPEQKYPSISVTPEEKNEPTVITLPPEDTSSSKNEAATVVVQLPPEHIHHDSKSTKNSTIVDGTVIKINGTLYVIKGSLTKLKSKAAHANKLVGSLLADVISNNSNEHKVNGTGVTSDGGEMFSYDGASSTTVEDKPFDAHVIKGKTEHSKKKLKLTDEKPAISAESSTPISHSKSNVSANSSLVSTPPPSPSSLTTHSYYPPKPLEVPQLPSDVPTVTMNKAIAAEAVHDTTSQNVKKQTACHIERKMAIFMDDGFVPECQNDGSYAPVQCFERSGFGKQCWCVNKKGEEIGNTRTTDGTAPVCEKTLKKYISSELKYMKLKTTSSPKKSWKNLQKHHTSSHMKTKLSQCEAEKKISKNQQDMFTPECQADGSYNPVQCFTRAHYGTHCWCVDETGRELSGSSVKNGTKPDCAKVLSNALSQPRCGGQGLSSNCIKPMKHQKVPCKGELCECQTTEKCRRGPTPSLPPPTKATSNRPTALPSTLSPNQPTANNHPPTSSPPTAPPPSPLEPISPFGAVNGGYTNWSKWTGCTSSCGSGMQERIRQCTNPTPERGGKDCTALGTDSETRLCNTEPCPGQCEPKCENEGQCISRRCQCTEMYEGKSCEKAICKEICLNNGVCVDPFKNLCRCKKGFCGLRCEKNGQACELHVFYFRVTNLAKKDVVFFSSDGIPQNGSVIGARRIVEIRKKTLSRAPVTFQVKSGNKLLLLNTKPGITLVPENIMKQPLSLTVTESIPQKHFFTNLRVTNLAKTNILLKASDNIPSKGFNISSNVIAEITKKTMNPKEVWFQAFDQSSLKALWVNGRQSFSVKPTEMKGVPVSLIIKATVPAVKIYHIVIQLTNLAQGDIILFPSDQAPKEGFRVRKNVIALIKKTTTQSTAVTFTVVNAQSKEPLYINGARTIAIVPKLVADTPEPLTVTRSAGDIKPSEYYLVIQVINKTPRKIMVIPDDKEPPQGFPLDPKTISLITKTLHAKQPVTFTAIDAENNGELLINNQTNISLVPTISKEHIETLTVTSETNSEETGQPQFEPYYFWSFLTIKNGAILGDLPFVVEGHVEMVEDGLYFDGLTGFLRTHLPPSNILANPDAAEQGLAFGIKLKFDGTMKEYDTARYVLDTGAKSGGNTGVSLYVLNGKLIAEIATPIMKWKAKLNLIYNQWLYIIINWEQSTGLHIALDGFPKSSDLKGSRVTGLEPSTQDPNFCLGRNVAGNGFYFTKFYLASLVVFKEFLPDSFIYQVYSRYRANAIVPRVTYHLAANIYNKFGKPVILKSSDNQPVDQVIPAGGVLQLTKDVPNQTPVEFKAFDAGAPKMRLAMNSRNGVRITPSTVKGEPHNIVIKNGTTASGMEIITSPVNDSLLKDATTGIIIPPWNIMLKIVNKVNRSIILCSSDNDPPQGFKIKRGYIVILSKTLSSEQIITFRAVEDPSQAKVLLNGKEELQVTAKQGKPLPVPVTLTESAGGAISSQTNKQSTAVEGLSQPTDGKTFIDIKISNQAGKDIVLISSDKIPSNGLTINKDVMLDFVKQFTGTTTVTFSAKDVATGQLVYLNGKKSLSLKSSSLKGQKFTIFATTKPGEISTVVNKAGSDIFIKCTDGLPKGGFTVNKGFIVVITKLTNSITPVRFSANDIHGKAVLLNGKGQLTLTPSTVKGQPKKITVQNDQGGPRYYIDLKLLNKAGSDIILKSSDHNPSNGFKIKEGLVVQITKTVATLHPVMFTAVDANGSNVELNNRVNIIVKPSPVKGNTYKVETTPAAGSNTSSVYFTSLKVINKHGGDIVLKSSDNYPEKEYIIKSNNIAVINKKSSSSNPVTYSVIDVQTKKPVLVNQLSKVMVKPSQVRGQPVSLLVGDPVTATKKAQVEQPSSNHASPIYYLVLKIANRAGYDATIFPSDSQPPEFQVRKGYVEVITKKSRSNRAVVFRAVKTGTNEILRINGKNSMSLSPKRVKGKPISLNLNTKGNTAQDKSFKSLPKTLFYVNLHVSNQSPGETVFFPAKDSPKSGFRLNPGTAINIKETVETGSPVTYVALRHDNHKPLLLNDKEKLVVTPARSQTVRSEVNITNLQATRAPPDRYITVYFHNALGREARVVPNKGPHKKNGYIIPPNSNVKLNIIIKGAKSKKPMLIRGEDLETESKLLLNQVAFPISLTPSDTPEVATNISISAEAPHARPQQSWLMSSLKGYSIAGSPSLYAHGKFSYVDDGLHFDGLTNSMDTTIAGSHCLHDPEQCKKGFSFGTKIRISKSANNYTEPRFILDTGGHCANTRGVSLFAENKKLVVEVATKNMKYRTSTPLMLKQWIYVTVTFKQDLGLFLYYNAQLRSMDSAGIPVPTTHPVETEKNLMIGRNLEGPPYEYASFDMGSLTVFEEYLSVADVNRIFIFFWNGESAKIYLATLRIINGAGRHAVLKPNRGNDEGFPIKPDTTQQIKVISMSTDDSPVEPVTFHAIDAETSSKLMINHFIRPFVVVPKDSKNELTTILITSPAPSILPKYIWNFKHVDVGVVRDSEPKLMVHGVYEPEEDSLKLLPGDTWIDVGDFKGQCISDPQLCDEGMALALKLKLNDEAKNYTDEPRFILDSGAHDSQSRGFSLHVQDEKLYCMAAISNAEWKVSTPISSHQWKYMMFTWKKNEGLSLYINGHLKDRMKHSINKPGLHHFDNFTRFAIARNVAGPPYKHAHFTINSLAFFDEYLSKAEALREYIYYWGNAVQSFSNRYIKVRFDNKAGTNVKITPSRGGAKDQGYSIKPHMSLELSFVAKGTSANVPVSFKAQDELSGDSLLINKSEEPFAVSPSDSKTHMTVATVTSSVKCLSPNGLFPDPTNEFGYINCTAGSAKQIPCGNGKKWEDETKTCQRKDTTFRRKRRNIPTIFERFLPKLF